MYMCVCNIQNSRLPGSVIKGIKSGTQHDRGHEDPGGKFQAAKQKLFHPRCFWRDGKAAAPRGAGAKHLLQGDSHRKEEAHL